MDRRRFLKSSSALGAGLVLAFHLPTKRVFAQPAPEGPGVYPPNAFVRIAPDNSITIVSKHTEMGQGIYTGLATILAEELDADWAHIKVESAPVNVALYANLSFGLQGTGGSRSIPNSWLQYRTVGATMRAMLINAAAKRWKIDAKDIVAQQSVLTHPSGKRATFGEMSELAATQPIPENVTLKTHEQFTLIGKNLTKVDVPEKVNGTAQFTIDVQRPGQLVAVVARAPRFGATLISYDDAKAKKVDGVVEVVQIPTGVAVLAKNTYAATQGRKALETKWDFSKAENRSIEDIINDFTKLTETSGAGVQQEGDVNKAFAEADKTFEATYVFPYLAHATMEPLDCTMELKDGVCVIRSGTQMPSMERDRVAQVLNLDPEKVQVEILFAGGGFGRRGNFVPELAHETATIVKATAGKYPIKLQLTREDDMAAGYYRPLFVHRIKTALDKNGNISAWQNRLVGQSFVKGSLFEFMIQNGVDPIAVEGSAHLPYAVPNVSVEYLMATAGVPTLAWRSVGHTHTAFSKETMLDELLISAGKDPVRGRLALMNNARAMKVVTLAAEKAGWGKNSAEGKGVGFAYVESFGAHVAQVAEISLDNDKIKVEKVVCAVDCGTPINPHIIEAQIESAIVFGLSAALYGNVDIKNGEVQTSNFHNYHILRIQQMPKIEVHIMPSTETPSGIGEPATPVIGPAVANAYFNLTGNRIRRLPFEKIA